MDLNSGRTSAGFRSPLLCSYLRPRGLEPEWLHGLAKYGTKHHDRGDGEKKQKQPLLSKLGSGADSRRSPQGSPPSYHSATTSIHGIYLQQAGMPGYRLVTCSRSN